MSKTFKGHYNYQLAKKYAMKRHKWWPKEYDQKGKPQGIFPNGETSLIVLSELEMKHLRKRNIIEKGKSYRKVFNRACYWNTNGINHLI